jgi:hypothetical protein
MIKRTNWVDRDFILDLPAGWLANVLERLYGTAPRLQSLTAGVSEDIAGNKPGSSWSIKEHIGHLTDLEALHDGRIDDFIERKEILRAADMTNQKTNKADHNKKSVSTLIEEFSESRNNLINRLKALDEESQMHKAIHPRLKKIMTPVDMAYFTAEHDDHHLATIREILSNKNLID